MTILAIIGIGILFLVVGAAAIYMIAIGAFGIGGGIYDLYLNKKLKNEKIEETKHLFWRKLEIMDEEASYMGDPQNAGTHIPFPGNYNLKMLNLIDGHSYKDYKKAENLPYIPEPSPEEKERFAELNIKYDNAIKQALNQKFEDAKAKDLSLKYEEWERSYYYNIHLLIEEAVLLGLSSGWKWHFDYRTYPPSRHKKYPWITCQEYAQYHLSREYNFAPRVF